MTGMKQMRKGFKGLFIAAMCALLLSTQISPVTANPLQVHKIGVNYGTLGNNLPNPHNIIGKIKSMDIGKVKVFSPDHTILTALAHSGLEVVVGIPNNKIENIASSTDAAKDWMESNIAKYVPATNIEMIVVGNEVFRDASLQSIWRLVVPAMQNIHEYISSRRWSNLMKVTTTVTLEMLEGPSPPFVLPSMGTFRQDLLLPITLPLLSFLQSTDSYLFMNVHPIYTYWQDFPRVDISYAMLGENSIDDRGLVYTNILHAQLDAMNTAMDKLGYGNVPITISETGWPTQGDPDQLGVANVTNAAIYNQRLVHLVLSQGTPMHPHRFIPTFIFSLFNENQKSGPTSERHWGLLNPDTSAVYQIDLTGKHPIEQNNQIIDLPILVNRILK